MIDTNLLGIILSFIYVFIILGLSTLLQKRGLSTEGSRKLVHIGVSNWWLIAMACFNNVVWASVVPAVFIVLNAISYRKDLFSTMERHEGKGDLGTVYYPISLLVLTILCFGGYSPPYAGALGVFIMGYGGGLAAVIGKRYGIMAYRIFGNTKSYVGSLTMLVVSFVVCTVILWAATPVFLGTILLQALILAVFATVVEAVSPFGLDNLTVPLLTFFLYQLFF